MPLSSYLQTGASTAGTPWSYSSGYGAPRVHGYRAWRSPTQAEWLRRRTDPACLRRCGCATTGGGSPYWATPQDHPVPILLPMLAASSSTARNGLWREGDGQRLEPAQKDAVGPIHRTRCPLDAVEPPDERGEGDLGLQLCQRCTQAVMHPAAEREWTDVAPGNVQGVGVPEAFRVPVGRPEQKQQLLARSDPDAPDLDGLHGHAAIGLHRRVIAQELEHGVTNQRRLGPQPRQLVRVPEQREEAVADQVAGGLEAGEEQEVEVGDQFLLGQPGFSIWGGRPQRRDDGAGTLLEAFLQVGGQVADGAFRLVQRLRREHFVEGSSDGPGPPTDRYGVG